MVALATPEWIDLAVAAGTALLAVMTWRLATATRRMAESSDRQLAELRRQADAAELAVEQGERTLGATTVPVLRLKRTEGDRAVVAFDQGTWSIVVTNEGPVPATVVEAKLHTRQPVHLSAVPGGAIDPGADRLLRGEIPGAVVAEVVDNSTETQLTLQYHGPGGSRQFTTAKVTPKGEGRRWLVTERERDKPGGSPRSGRAQFV